MRSPIKRQSLLSLLAAFSLFLSTIEYMIPKPIPFMRLGLTNLPILLGLYLLQPLEFFLLLLMKVLGQGLVNGTLFSYVFLLSIGSSFASGFVMFFLKKILKKRISPIGLSISGAMASNFIQLGLARLFIFGVATALFIGPVLLMGFVTSILLGIIALRFMNKSQWFKSKWDGKL